MRVALAWCCMACACGRIGFDPVGTPGDGRLGDGVASGSDAPADTMMVSACTFAIPVQLNVRKATSTCLGRDLVAGCGPAGTQEVVFAFTAPATTGYNFQAYDPGTSNISNSTAELNATCDAKVLSCAGILGLTVNIGETVYLVVEASSGGCANIEFEVT